MLNQWILDPKLARLPSAQLKLKEGLEALEKENDTFLEVNEGVTGMEF